MKHTKGKWLLEDSGLTMFKYSIETDDNSTEIARVGTKEDAKLISKAPEMYEALKDIIANNWNIKPKTVNNIVSLLKEIES